MEHSNNTIANVCVGIVMVRIRVEAPELFFRYSAEAKAQYWNPIEQLCEVIRRIGPSLDPIPEGGWMTFTPHPELPGFPTHTFDTLHKEHYYQKNISGLHSRQAELLLQFRTVPGQTLQSVTEDLTRLLEGIKREHPAFNYSFEVPAKGTENGWCQDPMFCSPDHALVDDTGGRTGARVGSTCIRRRHGAGSAMSATATSLRVWEFRPCSTGPATSASTRNGRPQTNACYYRIW